MPSGKDRLYVTLHARQGEAKMAGKEDTYHWGLLLGPKKEKPGSRGTRFNAREFVQKDGTWKWLYEEQTTELTQTFQILARILVAKVKSREQLVTVLRGVPVEPEVQGWNCVGWVKTALGRLEGNEIALGTRNLEWDRIRDKGMEYCLEKIEAHRYDGKGGFDIEQVPTFDLLKGRELAA